MQYFVTNQWASDSLFVKKVTFLTLKVVEISSGGSISLEDILFGYEFPHENLKMASEVEFAIFEDHCKDGKNKDAGVVTSINIGG